LKNEKHPAVWCIKNVLPITIQSQQDLLNRYEFKEGTWNKNFQSGIYFPLLSDKKPIGIFAVFSQEKYAYTSHHLEMIKTLSVYTTIALKNAETYEILNNAQHQLIESEKMAALGGLVAGVAHEINTPIGICVTAASRLDSKTKEFSNLMELGQIKKKDLTDYLSISQEGMKILLTNLQRAADLVQGFKRVAVEQSAETKRVFELKEYLEETVMALRPELKNKPFQIILEL
jgi:C4-dicarboxylate-specific signal transduction histidine kinase